MKKQLLSIVLFLIILIAGFILYGYFRPILILKDVAVYRHIISNSLGGNYYLYYKGQKIGYLSFVDTWYVKGSQVYGSLSEDNGIDDITYWFYIDICSKEVYITPSRFEFYDFLDKRNINEDKRNFMSGNNVINPYKHAYNRKISCPENRQP
ncbi:hypothetical protein [Neisseria sp.]|uniref:hypothetical protein n=1 Tax=Neisseria sp. TaxID=192066 RepID=UPI0026DBB82A|nr:hypothetical protein [Neisseria sp.]MDO4907326.1 hypothetical protein [Neisseria sp.]